MVKENGGDRKYTDDMIAEIILLKNSDQTWDYIAKHFHKKWKMETNAENIRTVYRRNRHIHEATSKESATRLIRQAHTAKKTNSFNARALRDTLENQDFQDSLMDRMKDLAKDLKKITPKKYTHQDKTKHRMALEAMISDVHFGKLVKEDGKIKFDLGICRRRLREFTRVILNELRIARKIYKVETLTVALLGDMIESATMHELESAMGCEFGNSTQIVEATRSLLQDVLMPLADTGIEIIVPCVTGNHDRIMPKKTFNNPGENNASWIIYKHLEMFMDAKGYTNVTFHIPDGPYVILPIFGDNVLYEHLDNVKSPDRKKLETLMAQRGAQEGKVIKFLRGGHFHDPVVYGRGRIIVNGSVPGQDSYAKVLGYSSLPEQLLNYYMATTERPNSFFKTFPVYLP